MRYAPCSRRLPRGRIGAPCWRSSSAVPAQEGDGDWLLVGIITAPFGVRGEVRVEVVTEFPRRFSRLRAIYLGDEKKQVALERAHLRGKGGVALKLAGCDTPEQANELRGVHL